MTRTCCCCIPVLGGATVIGIFGILLAVAFMTPFTTYLYEYKLTEDGGSQKPSQLNVISNYRETVFFQLEKGLKTFNVTESDIEMITDTIIKKNMFTGVMVAEIVCGVYVLLALLMMLGIHCDMRGLMIPHMMYQMLINIVLILVVLGVTVVLFFYKVLLGVVAAVFLLIFSFLLVYYWVAVQQAYVELGNRDYMYRPAPTKAYNGSHHYPSAPQRFEMHDRV